ncbi:hypothetical protein [Pseudomarimonas arenosa]|uniref:Uncharacterized protein n=1 Tax=Pseudomarimonas arenosa TaxID=2774145 RepID=A0AAW3ZQV8_9GAMM|nr:hypothetical protein [Pseudomarimonas arenosa]MBD8527869.1 hypothetical protein [Pseudomarimonas arenosa]
MTSDKGGADFPRLFALEDLPDGAFSANGQGAIRMSVNDLKVLLYTSVETGESHCRQLVEALAMSKGSNDDSAAAKVTLVTTAADANVTSEQPAPPATLDAPRSSMANPDSRVSVVAIGSSVQAAVEAACIAALRRFQSRLTSSNSADATPPIATMVLVAPDLPADFFSPSHGPYHSGALALESIGRLVILHCGRDTKLPHGGSPVLGRDGPVGAHSSKLSAIDISEWIENRSDASEGALRSLESLGLITRLLRGMAVGSAVFGAKREATT